MFAWSVHLFYQKVSYPRLMSPISLKVVLSIKIKIWEQPPSLCLPWWYTNDLQFNSCLFNNNHITSHSASQIIRSLESMELYENTDFQGTPPEIMVQEDWGLVSAFLKVPKWSCWSSRIRKLFHDVHLFSMALLCIYNLISPGIRDD